MARKPKGRPISGLFLLDKPQGLSSNSALQRVKRLYGAAKAGHTGALDPLATGLLPICLGEATKFSQYLLDSDKRYLTTAKLGQRTDTCDAEGQVIEEKPVPQDLSSEQIEALLEEHFKGEIEQVPPVYSALKLNGQPLYKLARQGVEVEVKPRQVRIHEIRLLAVRDDEVDLEVFCSKGTYIRSIVEDLGLLLGCGAHVTVLRRLQTGPFDASQMMTLEQLQSLAEPRGDEAENSIHQRLDALLLPAWSPVAQLPALELTTEEADRIRVGQRFRAVNAGSLQGELRLFANGQDSFMGIGEIGVDGVLKAKRLVSTV
ncbi:tRNA pseudouridine(55) synthase TruB [Marinobacterium sediminicola]|uniref:tRNA pseudouridine synthase B n=1 Tax=Marinobacterium sediminicola TaxID=518898 RepID=A0ABY1S3N6_9GAMM|nr:tRNA pseudouridine(55) synthase TruB [Marinobacterium sediminicola]ULG68909.1 tRNA pseudouridine(55) synthase TruB [Marinobacterium sediminicola]SMR77889.1 tRNA pseudouridine synthase B [Marinobacterium sediminicola]